MVKHFSDYDGDSSFALQLPQLRALYSQDKYLLGVLLAFSAAFDG